MDNYENVDPSSINIGDYIELNSMPCRVIKITRSEDLVKQLQYKFRGVDMIGNPRKQSFKFYNKVRACIITSKICRVTNIKRDYHTGTCGCSDGYTCYIDDYTLPIKVKDENLGEQIYQDFNPGKLVEVNINIIGDISVIGSIHTQQ